MPHLLETLSSALAGRYTLVRELGRGGMGTVYLARDQKHHREVALKVLNPDLGRRIGGDRFQLEVRLAAALQHPHICTVYDSGEDADLLWFTMPYVAGESLAARLERERTLPLDEALRIGSEVARALAYAHERGVVHRDIKPANLLLTRDGSTLVTDFGIARAVGSAERLSEPLTMTGMAVGTPAYMSPEQAAGDAALDGRSDMFSLGLVLYEMLAGERPFQQESASPFARLMVQSAPSLRQRRRELPAELDGIVKRALAADPGKRFPSMTAMAEELTALRFGRPVERSRPASAAVLPFRSFSAGEDQTYFGDGLAEELTTALSRIRGLKMAARSGAFRYRGADVDVRAAGRELGVATVLSGSVRRSGDRLRVSAQLASVEDGFEIWSDTYDRKMADVFEVQEEIAGAIAQALQVTLAAPEERPERSAPDVLAYDLYLRGRFAWHQRTGATLAEAMRYFEQAAVRDPGFARAWAGLADTCTLLPMYTDAEPAAFWRKAKEAAQKAIALDDTLADAHTSLAYGTMLYEWDWEGAEREFRLAIAVDPTYQVAHHWYADFLAGRGRLEEAMASMQRARELDPLSRITWVEIAWIHHMMGKMPEAEAALAEVFRVDPQYSHAHFMQGLVQLASGRPEQAVTSLRHSIELGGDHVHARGALISALAKSSRRDEALQELAAMEARATREHVPEFGFVVAYAGLGELDKAFAAMERAIRNKDLLLSENFFEPVLDPLKTDPRYTAAADAVRQRG